MMMSRMQLLWAIVASASVWWRGNDAFGIRPSSSRQQRTTDPSSAAFMTRGDGNDPLSGGELTSTLARMEDQWKLKQRTQPGKSRWTKLILPDENDEELEGGGDDDTVTEQLDPTIESDQDFVYLLEPPNSIPSCLIVFVGGAGLGQFPQIAYSELLTRISDRLNAAILTAPYQVGLDHFSISKTNGEQLRRAMAHCQKDPSRAYPTTLPTYCLAHSLGAKLQTIYMVATQQEYDRIGFMSYNNFGFSQTMQMAKSFAQQLQKGIGGPSVGTSMMNEDLMNTIFNFAEQAIGAIGLDFSPRKEDMDRLVQLKYNDHLQQKTRLFCFDDDTLDNSLNFVENCRNGTGPSLSGLPGNHLTPVYFRLGLDDLPEEARNLAAEASGGFKSASFGDEEELTSLVDEVCNALLGKPPTRGPPWEDEVMERDPPRIAGGVEGDS